MNEPSTTSFRTVAGMSAIFVLAMILRLYMLAHESFWIDEVSSVQVAAQPASDIVLNYRPGMHPNRGAEQAPLALMVMHFFLAPDAAEGSARLPSALLGVAGVLVAFLFIRRLFGDRIAMLVALLLALSPLHIWYSQEARWYALWIALTLLAYWALWRAVETGRRRAWIAYGLLTIASIYTFIFTFLVVAAQGMSVLWLDRSAPRERRRLPAFLRTHVAVAIATLPVLWMIAGTMGLTTGTPRPKRLAELPYTFFAYAAGYSAGPPLDHLHKLPSVSRIVVEYPSVVLFVLVFTPLVLLGIARVWRDRRAAAFVLPWCFAPPLLAFTISLVSNVTYQARYGSAGLPAFLILIALGIVTLPRSRWRWGAGGAVVACFLLSIGNHYWNPEYDKEDVRSAMRWMRAVPGTTSAPVAIVGQLGTAVRYYGPEKDAITLDRCAGDPTGELDHLTGETMLWLMVGRDWDRQGPTCVERLSRTHRVVVEERFPGVEVYLLAAPTGDAVERLRAAAEAHR